MFKRGVLFFTRFCAMLVLILMLGLAMMSTADPYTFTADFGNFR